MKDELISTYYSECWTNLRYYINYQYKTWIGLYGFFILILSYLLIVKETDFFGMNAYIDFNSPTYLNFISTIFWGIITACSWNILKCHYRYKQNLFLLKTVHKSEYFKENVAKKLQVNIQNHNLSYLSFKDLTAWFLLGTYVIAYQLHTMLVNFSVVSLNNVSFLKEEWMILALKIGYFEYSLLFTLILIALYNKTLRDQELK